MSVKQKRNLYKKLALVLSSFLLIVWSLLGTGASLAWFTDTSDKVVNIFHFAHFDLDVSHRLTDGSWEDIEGKTDIFDDSALYEPGYVQVVYLKIKNNGDRAFNFYTAVSVNDYNVITDTIGQKYSLPDHLRFGVVSAESYDALTEKVATRELAKKIAVTKLSRYDSDAATLKPGQEAYMAIVVRMPEEIGNKANYLGDDDLWVKLGIIVKAEQIID